MAMYLGSSKVDEFSRVGVKKGVDLAQGGAVNKRATLSSLEPFPGLTGGPLLHPEAISSQL